MHRSAFRQKHRPNNAVPRTEASSSSQKDEFEAIREQIANITESIHPIKTGVDTLSRARDDVAVPADIAQSLKALHSRLDKVETEVSGLSGKVERMSQAFGNAILKLSEKVEKHEGALAHSLDKLIFILSSRKLRIKRDNDGNMVELETEL